MIKISIVTFNILASNLTNFLYGDFYKTEDDNDMIKRYANIYNTLKYFFTNNVDVICLQEVDKIFYSYLVKYLDVNYSIHYEDNVNIKDDDKEFKLKRSYGLLTLINNDRFNVLDKIISNITPNHFLSKKNNNPDKIHKKKKVLIVNIELKNSNQNINFSIANTHLTGNKTRNEVRIEEIKHIMSMQNNCKFKFNNLIVGDFNYSNYKDIQNLITVNNYNMIDDYFLNNNFKSSFHKFNIKDWKQKKKEMYEEDIIYDTIDYILYSNTLEPIKDRLLILPNQETGVINANLPYQPKNNNNKDWYSDHVLIYQEFNII